MSVEDTDYSDEVMFIYGKALGKLHKISKTYIPKTPKWSYKEVLEWIEDKLVKYHAPAYMVEEKKDIFNKLVNLEHNEEDYGLVHFDFEPDNVFWDDKKGACSVIDFDDSMYHFYVIDFEPVFHELACELDGERLEQAKVKFVEGYRTENDMRSDYRDLLPLMHRFCELYSYSRLIRCLDEKFESEPDWMTELRKKLNNKVKRIEGSVKNRVNI